MSELLERYSGFFFDIDGTIVQDYNSTKLLPQVAKFFRKIRDNGEIYTALITNQGGVGFGDWAKNNGISGWEKYPTRETVLLRLGDICHNISEIYGKSPQIYFSFQYLLKNNQMSHPDGEREWAWDWRKPNGGMIKQAMEDVGFPPLWVLYVGDRPEDEGAAKAAGVDFMWAKDFFEAVQGS